jgi:hypothetical protein
LVAPRHHRAVSPLDPGLRRDDGLGSARHVPNKKGLAETPALSVFNAATVPDYGVQALP